MTAMLGCTIEQEPVADSTTSPPVKDEGLPAPQKKIQPSTPEARITKVDAGQLLALRESDQALIYDVRLPIYYKLGHIEGATLFYPKPFDEAFAKEESRMRQAQSQGKTIILYCGSEHCNDSTVVAGMIAERGIPVSVYPGGWDEWKLIGID